MQYCGIETEISLIGIFLFQESFRAKSHAAQSRPEFCCENLCRLSRQVDFELIASIVTEFCFYYRLLEFNISIKERAC